jgi:hypothetical protein
LCPRRLAGIWGDGEEQMQQRVGRSGYFTEIWKAGFIKTTIDLPEDLFREMKFRAVREGRKLRDVAAEVFRRGLAAPAPSPGVRHRLKLPIIPTPTGAKPFELSGERLLKLELEAGNPGA